MQQEWRDIADELERLCDDFERAHSVDWASAIVARVRMLVEQIRDEFRGN